MLQSVERTRAAKSAASEKMKSRSLDPGTRMPESLLFLVDSLNTPIGEMLIVADLDGNLRAVDWVDHEVRMHRILRHHYGERGFRLQSACNLNALKSAIGRYFEGELGAIDTLPVQTGGTPFQRKVWSALRNIPCGATVSYSRLAEQIGRPAAVRAVGLANGSNPVGVVVPCHRVIGADGSLTGYGGGIERKSWLLEHEGCTSTKKRNGGILW
jgi:methylated-DNA-[protein]-cysteine S-methyltransferase